MKREQIALMIGMGICALTVNAEVIEAPKMLVYAPNLLQQWVVHQGALPYQGALPAGGGMLIKAFAQILGLIAVFHSCTKANAITNTNSSQREGSWGGVLVMFFAGVCLFHIEKTMRTIAATFPGFPDLSPVLQY